MKPAGVRFSHPPPKIMTDKDTFLKKAVPYWKRMYNNKAFVILYQEHELLAVRVAAKWLIRNSMDFKTLKELIDKYK